MTVTVVHIGVRSVCDLSSLEDLNSAQFDITKTIHRNGILLVSRRIWNIKLKELAVFGLILRHLITFRVSVACSARPYVKPPHRHITNALNVTCAPPCISSPATVEDATSSSSYMSINCSSASLWFSGIEQCQVKPTFTMNKSEAVRLIQRSGAEQIWIRCVNTGSGNGLYHPITATRSILMHDPCPTPEE
ncbi:hypothetical protein Tco_0763548 [Tanacetum coccineum]